MKNLLLFALLLTLPLLLGGCGEKPTVEPVAEVKPKYINPEGINYKELEFRGVDEMAYHKGSPYTGKTFDVSWDGEQLISYKDGKADGLWIGYHPNGSKWYELTYKDDKLVEGSEKWWNSKGEPVDSQEEAEAE